MSQSDAIEPWFEPGSGWVNAEPWAPGSLRHIEAKNRAAYRCIVFLMRQDGSPLEPDTIMAALRYDGALVCERAIGGAWDAALYAPPAMENAYVQLFGARLVRMHDGFRQYQGRAWDRKRARQVPQTWLCAPDAESGLRVIDLMPRPPNRGAFHRTVSTKLIPTASRSMG